MALLSLFFLPGVSYGEAWVVTPSASIAATYDDNASLTTQPHSSSYGEIVTANIKFSRLTDISEVAGQAYIDYTNFNSESELSDQSGNQFLSLYSKYKTELGQWNLDASYLRDSTLRYDFDDLNIDVIQDQARRTTIRLEPSWTQHLSERLRFNIGYAFNDVRYSDESISTSLFDYDQQYLRGSLTRDLSERDSIVGSLRAGLYRAPDNNDAETTSYELVGTYNHAFSEITKGGIGVGLSHRSSSSLSVDEDDNGYLVRMFMSHQTELQRIRVELSHDIRPSGLGEVVEVNKFTLEGSQHLSSQLTGTLQAKAHDSKSLGANTSNDRTYFVVEPALRWNVSPSWYVEAKYRYRRQKYDDLQDSADSNSVYLTLGYSEASLLD